MDLRTSKPVAPCSNHGERAGENRKDTRRLYQRNYQRTWIAARRASYLRGRTCVQCGSDECLEIDHIDPRQKVSHRIWSWSAERLAGELAKCQILCHGCHLEKTRAENSKPLVHGTINAYRKKGCRCDMCRAANAARSIYYKRAARARAGGLP